ncbi:NAD(P)-dependent oxidoreductase [Microbacterium sp. NPDC058389]|uniref:NAD(P)-dependent oxidoreductase n=1 Tax=Microbacterium sp. NPDC058389 TaxID=3346475 RepID=UPI0036594B92
MTTEVAVVGLGKMGVALAERLLAAGHNVRVWNRSPGRADHLVSRGAIAVETLADAARADILISSVLDDTALASLHGTDGLLAGPHRPQVWIDCTTVSPSAAIAAASAAAASGVAFVSAPVSGNPDVVRSGSAIFALSGDDPDAVARCAEILQDVGRASYVVGTGAAAAMVKLCTNAVLGITMQALAEIAVLGERAGVDRGGLMAFINDSAIGSPFTRYKTNAVASLDLFPTFSPEGMRKDLRLAVDAGRALNVPAPLISAVEVEFSRLVASGLGSGLDFASLILQVARDAGVELHSSTMPVPA